MQNDTYKKQVIVVLVLSVLLVMFYGIYNYAKKNGGVNTYKSSKLSSDTSPYLHSDNSFSFRYPSDLKFSNTAEEVKEKNTAELHETVIFNSSDARRGFQVFIAPFENNLVLSLEDIQNSNPDLEILDSSEILVGEEKGLSFLSKSVGSSFVTREIWFSHQNKIYQVSAYVEFEKDMSQILSSWKWLE